MQIAIKAVADSDFDRWMPLWRSYLQFYKAELPEPVTLATWARFLDPAEPMYAALAVADGRAMGLVHSIYHRSSWASADYCYLQDLFVADDARGKGIGRALIEHVYADARRRGSPRVYWTTHESNRSAMQLYDSLAERPGFIVYRKQFA